MRRMSGKLILLAIAVAIIVLGCGRGVPDGERKEFNWPVMGTYANLNVRGAGEDAALLMTKAAFEEVNSELSVFVGESGVARLNAAAGNGDYVKLGQHAVNVLSASSRYYEESDGAFNPAVGPLVEAWGFFRGVGAGRFPPDAYVISTNMALCNFRDVELGNDGMARLAKAGMRLDFGAIAKGYAVDVAYARMADAGYTDYLVNLGGNMRCAGTRDSDGGAWRVAVRNPLKELEDEPLGMLMLTNGMAVATSGNYEQHYEYEGRRYSHIIDPRTGEPANGVAQVTVVANTAMDADALSTTCFVLGAEASRGLIEAHPDFGALFVLVDDAGLLKFEMMGVFAECFEPETDGLENEQ